MRRALGFFVLLISPSTLALGQRSEDDALKLLDRVVAHYQDAETVHLQATTRQQFHTDYSDDTSTSVLSAYIAPGQRFRYEGADSSGSGLIVSDGTTEWRLLKSLGEYASEPAGTYFASRIAWQSDDRALLEARDLLRNLTSLGVNTRAAHFLPDESLEVHGKKVRCTVLHFGTEDSTARRVNDSTGDTVVWIDPVSLTVLKVESRYQSKLMYGTHPAPYGRTRESIATTTYDVVELGLQPKPDTFVFVAPADTKEVATLPNPYPQNTTVNAAKGPSAAEQIALAHIGKPLPDSIFLHDPNGNEVTLTKFAGHPLLIDLWATWCGPCINELPMLNRIRKSTSGTDFQMIAIDEDTQAGVAADLLKRRGYDWQDFHFNRTVTQSLPTTGIPLIVLADATGKVVYYHTGSGDDQGLAQAIAKLGKQYESVKSD